MTAYRAPYDGTVRTTTIAVSAILAVVIVLMLGLMVAIPVTIVRVLFAALAGGIFVIPALSYRFAPTGYRVEPNRLIIERPTGPLTFPLDEPVEAWQQERLGMTIRTGGNGGLFGAYGSFRNKELGSFRVYARCARHYVVVRTPTMTIVVGPEHPEQFIRDVTTHAS